MKNLLKFDWVIIISILLLAAIGMLALYSVSTVNNQSNLDHFYRQLISVIIGLFLMFFFSLYDYRIFSYYSTKLYLVTIILLVLVLLFGIAVRGTSGWIGLNDFRFQPVEMVKIIMVVFLASFLAKKKNELSVFAKIFISMILVAIPVLLILKQPDFGSSVIIIGVWLGMLLVSGIDKKNTIILFFLILISFLTVPFLLKDYQKDRLINFVKPYNDPQGSGYNVLQSIVAVGSGGLWGKGLGHGSQSQLNFLPEKHTDFIFAVIAEELGFFGSAVVLVLFGIIFYRLKEIARLARDNFGYLLAIGIILILFLQLLVNVGMNIGIMPVAGVPLPFLSYGGSSLITMFAAIGLIQSVYIRRIKTLD